MVLEVFSVAEVVTDSITDTELAVPHVAVELYVHVVVARLGVVGPVVAVGVEAVNLHQTVSASTRELWLRVR